MILLQHLDVNDVSIDFRFRKAGIAKETAEELHRLMDLIISALEKDAAAKVEWQDTCTNTGYDIWSAQAYMDCEER